MLLYHTEAQELGSFSFALNLSIRILVACWCLSALVLVQSYTSCLVSYLMAPKFIPFLNTIDELANDPKIPFVVMKYTNVHSDLLVSKLFSNRKTVTFYTCINKSNTSFSASYIRTVCQTWEQTASSSREYFGLL